MGGNVLSACYQEKAPKNRRQLADIFRFSSLSPPPKNHLPRRHPQYPKGLFGTDIESGGEPLLSPPCMWVALDFSIFLLGKDDVVCSYKTGEMYSIRPFTGETRVRSILRFFSGITTKSWKSELPLCDPFLPFASGVWERGPVS